MKLKALIQTIQQIQVFYISGVTNSHVEGWECPDNYEDDEETAMERDSFPLEEGEYTM